MSSNRNLVSSDLKNHLKKNYGDTIKDVVLSGTQVRFDSDKNSDYDVLGILKDNS